jgi:AraC-like DNA-binding protein
MAGAAGDATVRILAQGHGWRALDVLCTSGPDDRPFEEQHSNVTIAVVVAGTFQYRSRSAPQLLVPGSFLLGSPDDLFECAHHHGTGDRCVSFQYTPEHFQRTFATHPRFRLQRLPPSRASASFVARACAALERPGLVAWDALSMEIAARALQLANDTRVDPAPPMPSAVAHVTRIVRAMERHPEAATLPLQTLADDARLSPYHFLRTFTRVTGITPHQFALRTRLRDAAMRLATSDARVLDVALDSGFGDLSNFNRTFRAEFGVAPRTYRRQV